MKIPFKLLRLIKKNKSFLIVSHINPDGDSTGSCIALALGLKKLGKHVYILSRDPVLDVLKFLPCSDLINNKTPSMDFDVLLLLDCDTLERAGFSGRSRKHLKAGVTAVIDHHQTYEKNKSYVSWSCPGASATGELIYKLLKALHVPIDKKIAINLYTAIFMDTGGFRFSNTNIETLMIASKLIKAGANTWEITKEVYDNISLSSIKLLTQALLTLEKKGRIAWIIVTRKMFKNTNTSAQDTENFADHPRRIKGVEVGVFLREEGKTSYKVSLRSKGAVNVADVAKTFGGGGHASAAGCKLNGTLREVKGKILKAVRKAVSKK